MLLNRYWSCYFVLNLRCSTNKSEVLYPNHSFERQNLKKFQTVVSEIFKFVSKFDENATSRSMCKTVKGRMTEMDRDFTEITEESVCRSTRIWNRISYAPVDRLQSFGEWVCFKRVWAIILIKTVLFRKTTHGIEHRDVSLFYISKNWRNISLLYPK